VRKPVNNPLISEPLIQQGNGCTIPVKIHPIRSETLILYTDGDNRKYPDYHPCLVHFDGRQWWECYWYDVGMKGWNCERNNVVLRLDDETFERIFGRIEVLVRKTK